MDQHTVLTLIDAGLQQCGVDFGRDGGLFASLFMAGLVGGWSHCAGMCGPFVLAQVATRLEGVPASRMTEFHRLTGAAVLPYHFGRATTYAGIGAAAALLAGVPLGMLAGLAGGWVDALISRITDAMLSVPFLILAIALAAFLGPALENAMLAIAISAAPIFVRLARGMAMEAKATEWVEAARALGNPPWRTAVVHVLPNIVPPLLVQATLAIAEAIIAEASLSFLGLGAQPPLAELGAMASEGRNFLFFAPHIAVIPCILIFLVGLGFNILGDALRDALDPKLRR